MNPFSTGSVPQWLERVAPARCILVQSRRQSVVAYQNPASAKSDHERFVHAYLQPSLGSVRYAHEKGQRHAPVRTAHATQSVPTVCGPIEETGG